MPIDANFRTTKWTLVVTAAGADGHALQELCMTYWPALYRHVRRMGYGEVDAEDLTQTFFSRLLEKQLLTRANPTRGRFRTFLLTALHRFVINEWHRKKTIKQGGDRQHFSIDFSIANQTAVQLRSEATPEAEFQREWALCVIENAFKRLREEHIADGKWGLFEALAPCIVRDHDSPDFATVAESLGCTVAAAKMAATRTRKRLREMILDEIRATVASEDEVEDELFSLFASLTCG